MGHASVTGNGGSLKTEDVTVAMLLKQAGYRTCMIGKWWLVGKWKLHRRGKDRFALHDLENDIAEEHDLADQMPEIVARCSKYSEEARR
jgi:hypothetical protein